MRRHHWPSARILAVDFQEILPSLARHQPGLDFIARSHSVQLTLGNRANLFLIMEAHNLSGTLHRHATPLDLFKNCFHFNGLLKRLTRRVDRHNRKRQRLPSPNYPAEFTNAQIKIRTVQHQFS